MGGTRARINSDMLDLLTLEEVLYLKFNNEYVKESLIERKLRMNENRDISDLIDEKDIRKNILKKLK